MTTIFYLCINVNCVVIYNALFQSLCFQSLSLSIAFAFRCFHLQQFTIFPSIIPKMLWWFDWNVSLSFQCINLILKWCFSIIFQSWLQISQYIPKQQITGKSRNIEFTGDMISWSSSMNGRWFPNIITNSPTSTTSLCNNFKCKYKYTFRGSFY